MWRCRSALFGGLTLSSPGEDGTGTISWIFDIGQRAREVGPALLFGDFYHTPYVGGGAHSPALVNVLWRAQYALLSVFWPAVKVYDVGCLLMFVLNGWAGYLLVRELTGARWIALVSGLLFVSLEPFDRRVPMHNGLALYGFQILALLAAIRAARRPSVRTFAVFAVAMVFGFLGNEYYGYFGLFFTPVVFLGYLALSHWRERREWLTRRRLRELGVAAATGIALLISLLLLFYPHVIGRPLLTHLGLAANDSPPVISHPDFDFDLYAAKNVWGLFHPSIDWLTDLVPAAMKTDVGTYECTYHIGVVVPLFAIVLFGVGAWLHRRRLPGTRQLALEAAVWLAAIAAIIPFGIDRSSSLSMVPLTMRIAPVFRVGVRAMLFVEIGWIVLLALGLNSVLLVFGDLGRTVWRGALLAFVCVFALFDLRPAPRRLWSALPAYPTPPHAAGLKLLASRPRGYVLELPYLHEPFDKLENEYLYLFDRTVHHQPILNFMTDPRYSSGETELATLLNHPTGALAPYLLQRLGVRYLVIHTDRRYDLSAYEATGGLELLWSDWRTRIFEVKNPTHVPFGQAAKLFEGPDFEAGLLPTNLSDTRVVESTVRPGTLARVFDGSPERFHAGFLSFGPYVTVGAGRYEVTFWISGRPVLSRVDRDAAYIEVTALEGTRTLQKRSLRAAEFGDGQLIAFTVPVTLDHRDTLEFRTALTAPGRFLLDHISYRRVE